MSILSNPASSTADQTAQYTGAILDLLGDRDTLDVLRETPAELRRLIAGLPADTLRKAEAPGKWAINQVLQHLADSELVWGFRLRMVIAHDRPQLTGYDQDLWADRLGYVDADPGRSLNTFSVLREDNLRLLERLDPDDLQRVGLHSQRGEESLEKMLGLYAGHDIAHLRQIDRIRQAAD